MIERLEATLTKYNQLQTELMSEDVLKNINTLKKLRVFVILSINTFKIKEVKQHG